MERYCLGCMEPIENEVDVCPRCGYAQSTPPGEVYHLEPGTILKNRYLVGRVLGFGGFGVTYIGRDLVLENVVAIKEYLPSEFATRVQGQQTLSVYTGEAASQFDAGLKSFSDEAKRLAKFKDVPGVVEIADTFSENKTAYIVMEYLEGETVKQLLEREGKLTYSEAEEIMTSVLATLSAVHPSGIIHRDVSPANIFLLSDKRVKLLDFGAARFASAYHTKSLSVILKPGYAPEEQYRSHGNQGPWTDVYSAAATMYKMLTGKTPQESIERMAHDELKEPSKLGVRIDKNKENALMNALNVDVSTRTQSASQFLEEIKSGEEVDRIRAKQKREDEGKWTWWMKVAVAFVPIVLSATLIFLKSTRGETMKSDLFEVIPNLLNLSEMEAREELSKQNLNMRVVSTVDVDFGDSGLVVDSEPKAGEYTQKYGTVEVSLSLSEDVYMPDVMCWDISDAQALLEDTGLNVKVIYEENTEYAENIVIWQEFEMDEQLSNNKLVKLNVAVGAPAPNDEKTVDVPDVSGMKLEDAVAMLRDNGLYARVVEQLPSEEYEYGVVTKTFDKDTRVAENSVVTLQVSTGNTVRMPNLFLKSKEEALRLLLESGFTPLACEKPNNDYEDGLVISQSFPSGQRLEPGMFVTFGVARNYQSLPPQVIGKPIEEIIALYEGQGVEANISYVLTDDGEYNGKVSRVLKYRYAEKSSTVLSVDIEVLTTDPSLVG